MPWEGAIDTSSSLEQIMSLSDIPFRQHRVLTQGKCVLWTDALHSPVDGSSMWSTSAKATAWQAGFLSLGLLALYCHRDWVHNHPPVEPVEKKKKQILIDLSLWQALRRDSSEDE